MDHRKNILFAGGILLTVTLIAMMAAFTVKTVNEKRTAGLGELALSRNDEASSPRTVDVAAKERVYTIREYDGTVGIFDGDGRLIRTLNVPVVLLPTAERSRLKTGFTVNSEEALGALIEDYTG